MNKNIPIIIPSYEPDESLVSTCKGLIDSGLSNIVVVNDGSAPESTVYFEKLKSDFGITVLVHEVNKGKGRALKTAFEYILSNMPEAIGCITADSDGQHLPKDIKRCMDALIEKPNSLVLGVRDFSGENVPAKSKFGNNLTKNICSFLCGIKISDTQTGLRGISADFMRDLLKVKGERFEFETNMLIESKGKCEIVEVQIETVYDSKENHKTHFNPIVDSIKIYKIFAKMFVKYVFSSLSSFLLDIALFALFSYWFEDAFPVFCVTIATVLARVISSVYNYLVNYGFVFKSKRNVRKSMPKYFLLAAIQMLLSATFVTLGKHFVGFIPHTCIKVLVDLILFMVSYYFQNRFVF